MLQRLCSGYHLSNTWYQDLSGMQGEDYFVFTDCEVVVTVGEEKRSYGREEMGFRVKGYHIDPD
jgi:hypothetical protein